MQIVMPRGELQVHVAKDNGILRDVFTTSERVSKRPIIRYIYVRIVNVVIYHAISAGLYPDFNT